MRRFKFNKQKNTLLKKTRGISFEEAIEIIRARKALADIKHPNRKKYPHQRLYIIEINRYAYVIPYVFEAKDMLFLKTLYPSRLFTKKYVKRYEKQTN